MNLIPLDALSESAMLGESIRDGDLVSPSRCSVRCDVENLAGRSAAVNHSWLQQKWRATRIHSGMPLSAVSY